MRKFFIGLVLVAGVSMFMGCETMTNGPEQQITKYSRISELNRRMLAEDVDAILLLDRPSILTPWYVRSR